MMTSKSFQQNSQTRDILKSKLEIKNIGQICSIATTIAFLAVASATLSSRALAADAAGTTDSTEMTRTPNGEPSVDVRIKELHDKLKITEAQETLWTKVTKEMRDHAKTVQALVSTRNDKAGQMTAIDDLKSYAEIAQIHADGMKHFLDVFAPLYGAMTDAQKKNADGVFQEHINTRTKKHQTALKG
jgi:Skp family chaperone for outer membrane proteins